MLKHLHISNYALIESLDIDFPAGLTTVTGETGAGKSIMLGALSLLQGARADSRRSGQADGKTVVEGTFDISGFPRIAPLLQQLEIEECQQEEMLMRREISASGRSRAFINDTPVPLATMARVAASVIDIHSQHANLLLSDPAYQLSLLDAYADNAEIRDRYSGLYTSYRDLRARINALKEAAARARENEEFIAFRLDHLRKLKPLPGEQEALEARQRLLSDASAISENLSGAAAALSQADAGVLDSLAGAEALLRKVNLGLFADNPDSASLLPRLESARLELADIAASLESMLETVDADPSELEKIEERLDRLYDAQRRFGVHSEAELIELQKQLEKDYASLSGDNEDIRALEQQLHSIGQQLKAASQELTASRAASAEEIAGVLLELARPLGLPNLRLLFTLTQGRLTASGADTPSLLVSFNKNSEMQQVQNVASGGEAARLMLCLKALMARHMALPTIIFDEVDTGVSGDIAHRMGALMHTMAASMQVITITHLPQVAAKGDAQLKVYKTDSDSATHTHIRLLSPEEREEEIAAMLSGAGTTEAARLNARTLLTPDS